MAVVILRLDPRLPLVWRTPTSLQLGLDPVRARFDEVSHVTERLLAALAAGTTRGGLDAIANAAGGTAQDVEALLERARPALASPALPERAHIAVCGSIPTADRTAELLSAHGVRVSIVRDPGAIDGLECRFAILTGHFVLPPDLLAAWLRRDVPHLPVVFGDQAVTIGPLIRPGAGPCLHCIERTRTDADASWPAMAAQLLNRPSRAETRLLSYEAATRAARVALAAIVAGDTSAHRSTAGQSVRIGTDGRISRRSWRGHPECLCSDEALQEIGSAVAPLPHVRPASPRRVRAHGARA